MHAIDPDAPDDGRHLMCGVAPASAFTPEGGVVWKCSVCLYLVSPMGKHMVAEGRRIMAEG